MSEPLKPNSESFTSSVRHSEAVAKSSPRIIEGENDFPFDRINFVRIGSAHTSCKPEHRKRNADLFARLVTYVAARYEPDQSPATIEIELR